MKLSLCLVSACLLLLSCTDTTEQKSVNENYRYVRTLSVEAGGQAVFRELPGVVAANREANLSFRIAGKLVAIDIKEGDSAEQGQLLARLDDTDTLIRLKSDQASYDRALADFNRGKALIQNNTISQADYNQLQSNLAAAEANLETTKQNLAYAELNAPFSGVIAKRLVDNFEEIQAKQSIFVLQDVSTIDIKVDVPESIMILTNDERKPNVVAIFDAIPDRTFPLTLKELSTQADPDTNTYEVTMSMPNIEGYSILPGMSVTARAMQSAAAQEQLNNTVFVPAHAILEDAKGRYAFVALPKGNGLATIERRSIVSGQLSSLGLEVLSGLKQGDELVVAGMSKMFDGLTVKINQE